MGSTNLHGQVFEKAPGKGIVYRDGGMPLEAFLDVDWAGSPLDQKTTRCCIFRAGDLISWKSKNQTTNHPVISTSSLLKPCSIYNFNKKLKFKSYALEVHILEHVQEVASCMSQTTNQMLKIIIPTSL